MSVQEMRTLLDKPIGEEAGEVCEVQDAVLGSGGFKEAEYIYVIGNLALRHFKIGRSMRPVQRVAEVTGVVAPFKCDYSMLFHTEDGKAAEKILHLMFRDSCTNGEWFKLSEKQFQRLHRQTVLDVPLTEHANEQCGVCRRAGDGSAE